jgi:AcrR family transcriptional regulator
MNDATWDRGRVDQKLRTRQALMDAAVDLVKAGLRPSVATVADQARVSRATAYRYFPSQDLMLSEALVRAGARAGLDPIERGSQPADPMKRTAQITRQAAQFSLDHEERLRTALRLSLDPNSGYQRPGRRGQWVAEMLGSLSETLDDATRERLSAALNLVVGVDAIVVLTDIVGLDRSRVAEVLEWIAVTLVDSCTDPELEESEPPAGRRRGRAVGA